LEVPFKIWLTFEHFGKGLVEFCSVISEGGVRTNKEQKSNIMACLGYSRPSDERP